MWVQHKLHLRAQTRGFHLITRDVMEAVPELARIETGLMNLFLRHSSASLTINENADPSARRDLEVHLDTLAPERAPHYSHTFEGDDDMPAHIKSSLLGVSLTIPVQDGALCLGTWQGIYLCEHRDHGGRRELVATLFGQPKGL